MPALWLRQSTARTVVMGPFIDSTDFKTPLIALDITEQEVLLSKNGGAFTLKSETTHGVHDAAHNGWYTILLDTTDTNTLGLLSISISMSGALPVWAEFQVVEEQVWDSFCSNDLLDVNAAQWLGTGFLAPGTAGTPDVNAKLIGGTAQTGNDIGLDVNDILTDTGTTLDGRIPAALVGGRMDSSVGAVAAGAIGNAAFGTDTTLRNLYSGLAAAGSGTTTLVFAAGASDKNNFYDGAIVQITAGTAIGQARVVKSYVGSTLTATLTEAWTTIPVVGDTCVVIPMSDVEVGYIMPGVIANATFAADVGSTAYATNIVALAADKALLNTVTPNQTTILARLGAWTGTGVNTLLGAFKALLSKAASAPSDIGGTFDPATDSVEAIRDTAPLGSAMRGTDSAALASTALSNAVWTDAKAGYLVGTVAQPGDEMTLSATGIDEILDEVVEGTTTFRQMMRILASRMVGKATGGGTATLIFRDIGDTKPRVTMTVDSDGNRSAVTLDGA